MRANEAKAEAKRLGKPHYFTGEPCKYGHIAPRNTSNGCCFTCAAIETSLRRKTPLGKIRGALSRSIGRAKLHGGLPIDPATIWAYPEDNLCELCKKPPKSGSLHSDHNHDTGVFRGWICYRCNSMCGNLEIVGIKQTSAYIIEGAHVVDHT